MENKNFEQVVIEKLMNMGSDFAGRKTCVAWTTFPYNKNNLKVVEKALGKLNWKNDEYILTYDENLIFVKKDLI
ncbi:hypothetical protein [Methanobacterium sp.]|uniref:hypothetical protein n=1 Tax=Methanobacterium sp. TaxID=2164 RepID=UPI003C762CFA